MSNDITLAVVDPQSYRNFEAYDYNLLTNIQLKNKTLIGNIEYGIDDGKCNFRIIKLYEYSKKKGVSKLVSYICSQIYLYKHIKIHEYSIIHFQWLKLPLVDYFLLKLLKRTSSNIKIIYTAHNLLPHNTGNKYLRIYKKIFKTVDGIIVHSQVTKRELIRKFDIGNKNIFIIQHGVLRLQHDSREVGMIVEKLRDQHGLADKLIFSFLGNIHEGKGIDLLVRAWENSALLKNNDKVKVIIAGKSNSKSRYLFKKLSKIDNVYLDIRNLTNDEFTAYLKVSDVVILPYKNISQSGLLLSAIFEKVPVLVSNVGGLSEPFEIGQIGWILDELNEATLAKYMEFLVLNKNRVKDIKNNSLTWEKIHSFYSWKNIGKKTLEAYKKVCGINNQ